ncbi:ferrous iron transport protein A [Candidatus Bipolaricaulota bacterium]|nr:ferrous iron transport protein A [Candidatus Bipolaricaulota bacterium]MBS3824996.1 ferrous iron transport protein A [Candidatus Bipolaricaulota bacterium]
MTLSSLNSNQQARIVAITGGSQLRQKLALRGISEGVNLKVISSNGPVTVKINGNLVTIGRGMAKKVRVNKI